ncbi:MAG TPA: type IV toxin-antitoxin system AbiEi family antitoxin domain-containing protein [Candidatus Rifleibacterium sp.]|nr:type IV toxin-antitoxin system AbiEi family antitoxin domain-containing protein [Candidatus Rifleibacterium sp.]
MDNLKAITDMLERQSGIVTTAQVSAAGIPRLYLSKMTAKNLLRRVERGIYAAPEAWEDEMFLLQYKYSKGIFSHETALYVHGFTDRTPTRFVMTFPYGYHAQSIASTNVRMKKTVKSIYELGIVERKTTFGNKIRLYNLERTLCDIVKGNNSCDIQIVNQAMKRYALSKEKNISRLLQYAEQLRVKPKILAYMEILL